MKYEDAACDRPCGQEPMGCATCEMVTGALLLIGLEEGILVDDGEELHDDICASRKGYECNCPAAVFRRR